MKDFIRTAGTRDTIFLAFALSLSIFLHACYMSGFYYDHDTALIAGKTFFFLKSGDLFGFLKGIIPPGMNVIYLLAFSLFGRSFISIQVLSLLFNLAGIWFLHLFAKHVLGPQVRLSYLLPFLYALFSATEAFQGHTSNTEAFYAAFEIAAVLCVGLALKRSRNSFLGLAGVLLGAAVFIKQSVLVTAFACACFLFASQVFNREPWKVFFKRSAYFAFGFLAPVLLAWGCISFLGMGEHFLEQKLKLLVVGYFGNISVIRQTYMPWGLQTLWKMLKFEIVFFGLSAFLGVMACLRPAKRPERLLVLFWFLIPVLLVSRYGFHFRHHFLQVLASFLTLGTIGLSALYERALVVLQNRPLAKRVGAFLLAGLLSFPYVHIVFPLIQNNKLKNSFFLTERFLRSPDKEKYIPLLLNEDFDAGRRFLAAQYVRERTTEKDDVFVWDDIAGYSVYLWADRSVGFRVAKTVFLPEELGMPVRTPLARVNPQLYRHLALRRKFMGHMRQEVPKYIVVVKSYIMVPHARFTPEQTFQIEKDSFREFFEFLDKNYTVETQLYDILIFKRK